MMVNASPRSVATSGPAVDGDEQVDSIQTEIDGDVVVVRINRPQVHNALDPDSMITLRAILEDFRDNDDLSVAILTGAGDRSFCAGSDLRQTTASEAPFAATTLAPYEVGVRKGGYIRAITLSDINVGKPMIAAINGHALGGGLEIALDCHLRIASPNATFGLPEARWATVPAVGGLSHLLRAVPQAIAMKMLLTGERIDAAEALRIGLVSDVVEASGLLDAALDLAHRVAANGPLSIRAIATMSQRTYDLPLSQSIIAEQAMWGLLRDTSDRVEGRLAFAERRTPSYRGQ
jgi:E-phenylitaconyl-CoA hydratase